MAAINTGSCTLHRDFGVGLDVLFYAGNFYWGELVLPQLQLKIELQEGDVVVMDSGLFQNVEQANGPRASMVFFTKMHNELSTAGNELKVPD